MLHIFSLYFKLPLLIQPWIKMNGINNNLVLIHYSKSVVYPHSWYKVKEILENYECRFVSCNPDEYEHFPLKNLVTYQQLYSIEEMYQMIHGCRLFIGNQSSPLAMAMSLFKPCIALLTHEPWFYAKKYYPKLWWIGHSMTDLTDFNI